MNNYNFDLSFMSDYVLGSATEDGLFFTFICLLIILLVGLCMICISKSGKWKYMAFRSL